ncbi:MAG TPA: molybdopterin-dependent oxidoreductase [Magnetospirillaceae bacterium]|jgi:biotin/methionine sulfoxide reductase
MNKPEFPPNLSQAHWGTFEPVVRDGQVVAVRPFARDPDPSPIIHSIPDGMNHKVRVTQPAVRKSWLENGPGAGRAVRGGDAFVPVSWDRAVELVTDELKRVIGTHGNQSIYAGSYGWASAGRFHHAQSQLKRFLALMGGFVNSVDTYSNAAGTVLTRRVLGTSQAIDGPHTSWGSIAQNAQLLITFGGVPTRNTQVTSGGVGAHTTKGWLFTAKEAGAHFINISPMRDDLAKALDAEWVPTRPGSDTALIMALTHTLIEEDLHDEDFLHRCCVGFETYRAYLLGHEDGVVKDAAWAAPLCELPAETIRALARRMAQSRTFIIMNWSLQRSDHGEQPYWALIALAAALGQIGSPGGGFAFGLGSMEGMAGQRRFAPRPTFPIGRNPVGDFIPVARVSDMLLNPGQPFQYNGKDLVYPDIKLVYWCGGNPFHHHQDLNRLVRAFRQPETVIVHEPWWTATARHADIVLPSAMMLERNDIGASAYDRFVVAMKQAANPNAQARTEYAIFSDFASAIGKQAEFTEGRGEMEWLRHMYETAQHKATAMQLHWPEFDEFWSQGFIEIPEAENAYIFLETLRRDPERNRLNTPSGKIEIESTTIAGFNYPDCPGHPTWFEPEEWLGAEKAKTYPLHMLSPQPSTRLHSQLDMGRISKNSKIADHEPMRINRADAVARGIQDGDIVRIFNDRGETLAGAIVTDALRPGVVQLSTGAWYDPADPAGSNSLEKHGNPNVLTRDSGTSRLAQGSSAQSTLVQVEKFTGDVPPVTAFDPPI